MSLRTQGFQISYNPGDDSLNDFFLPVLSTSVRYDRSAGYWSSAALAVTAAGIAKLIQNNGSMRLLVGADLSEADVRAIEKGHSLEGIVEKRFVETLEDIENVLVKKRLEALAWMVAEGTLEIKVVLPTDKQGRPIPAPDTESYYHPKEGVFTDIENNQVAFCGSINESRKAIEFNYESFMVYKSWDATKPYIAQVVHRFENLWEGKEKDWIAFPVPEAARRKLLAYKPSQAPTHDPLEPVEEPEKPTLPVEGEVSQDERILFQYLRDAPFFPNATRLGIETSAIAPWPHQELIVKEIVERFPERFMLCDEVGLGKTIEAGMVIRQLMISGRVKQCLILAPKSVAKQWQEELYEKFSLDALLCDGHTFRDYSGNIFEPDSENLWDSYPLVITSSQLVKRKDRQEELARAAGWDLILVDEAHHARRKDFLRDVNRPNRLLELLYKLKNKTDGMILLTATPMQIHPVEVYDLLKILGMGGRWGAVKENFLRYFRELALPRNEIDWHFIITMMKDYFDTGGELDIDFAREAEKEIGPVEWATIRDLPQSQKTDSSLKTLSPDGWKILRAMARLHTPVARYIYRNTRDVLREYKKRGLLAERVPDRIPRLEWIPMQPKEAELYCRIEEYIRDFYQKYEAERAGLGFIMTVYRKRLTSSFYAMQKSLERRLEYLTGGMSEYFEDDDIELADLEYDVSEDIVEDRSFFQAEIDFTKDFIADLRLIGSESKVDKLISDIADVLKERETVIIFTQYTDTMDFLRDKLRDIYGKQTACYSGRGGEFWNGDNWESTTKEIVKNDFRKGENIKILICSPAAGEGLNLQTCGVLINYDMPWNPMRVEQRIGRIDRIGQKYQNVWIRNYFYEDTVEADVYRRLDARIGSFENVVGRLQPILARVTKVIEDAAMAPQDARSEFINAEVEEINRSLDKKEGDIVDLDALAMARIDSIERTVPPVTLSDIKIVLLGSENLGYRFRPHAELEGAYILDWLGKNTLVTFDSALFDRYPNTLQLLTYGNPLFQDVLASVSPPVESKDKGLVAKVVNEVPFYINCYYGYADGYPVEMFRLGGLSELVENRASAQLIGLSIAPALLTDIETYAAKYRYRASACAEMDSDARKLALFEKARQLLKKAALIEIAVAEKENEHIPFVNACVRNLARHKYPFAGLLRLTPDIEKIPIANSDAYYIKIHSLNADALQSAFSNVKSEACKLLKEITSASQAMGRSDIHVHVDKAPCIRFFS